MLGHEVRVGSLSQNLPEQLPAELVTILAQGSGVRVERIVSRGHASPAGSWYDQDEHEFVLLAAGEARLLIEGQGELELRAGDHVLLPAHLRHRVTWTHPDVETIWLAVFYRS